MRRRGRSCDPNPNLHTGRWKLPAASSTATTTQTNAGVSSTSSSSLPHRGRRQRASSRGAGSGAGAGRKSGTGTVPVVSVDQVQDYLELEYKPRRVSQPRAGIQSSKKDKGISRQQCRPRRLLNDRAIEKAVVAASTSTSATTDHNRSEQQSSSRYRRPIGQRQRQRKEVKDPHKAYILGELASSSSSSSSNDSTDSSSDADDDDDDDFLGETIDDDGDLDEYMDPEARLRRRQRKQQSQGTRRGSNRGSTSNSSSSSSSSSDDKDTEEESGEDFLHSPGKDAGKITTTSSTSIMTPSGSSHGRRQSLFQRFRSQSQSPTSQQHPVNDSNFHNDRDRRRRRVSSTPRNSVSTSAAFAPAPTTPSRSHRKNRIMMAKSLSPRRHGSGIAGGGTTSVDGLTNSVRSQPGQDAGHNTRRRLFARRGSRGNAGELSQSNHEGRTTQIGRRARATTLSVSPMKKRMGRRFTGSIDHLKSALDGLSLLPTTSTSTATTGSTANTNTSLSTSQHRRSVGNNITPKLSSWAGRRFHRNSGESEEEEDSDFWDENRSLTREEQEYMEQVAQELEDLDM